MLKDRLENIRKKSYSERQAIAFFGALVITAGIITVWFITIVTMQAQETAQVEMVQPVTFGAEQNQAANVGKAEIEAVSEAKSLLKDAMNSFSNMFQSW